MSTEIKLVLPKTIADILKKKAEDRKTSIEELILRAIVKIIEEEMK